MNSSPAWTAGLNWLDVVLIVVLSFSAIHSLRRGFSREVVGLAASLAALVLGMWFYGLAGSIVAPYVGSPRTADLLGFAMVVIAVLLVGALFGWIVSRFIRTSDFPFSTACWGPRLALLKGLLITVTILTAFMAFGPRKENDSAPAAVVHSRIAPLHIGSIAYFCRGCANGSEAELPRSAIPR